MAEKKKKKSVFGDSRSQSIGPEKSILEESNGGDSDDIDVEAFEGFV